ncbi:T9SS type A sorting domain-containing protein [Seonamhaeicola maritimus]|uniref:T9SS type A sorting domain-containing protein n=1 Tax=Seonamhaeicola maritimus TaxID=2591822 RepID=UPI00249565D4|nr:T9SS type A sorting domain-containing protein [Seonamhaeicola maritimus]
MKKIYSTILFAFIALTINAQNIHSVTVTPTPGTAVTGTGTNGNVFSADIQVEQGGTLKIDWDVFHATLGIERAFAVIKVGSPATASNLNGAYNDQAAYPGYTSPYTATHTYNIAADAAMGQHTLRLNGKRWIDSGNNQWGTALDITIDVVAAGTLSTEDKNAFEFKAYPNPVKDVLHINTLEAIQKVEVFDLLGKSVLTQYNVMDQVDVSSLNKSLYILKLTSDNGVSTKKFVKE